MNAKYAVIRPQAGIVSQHRTLRGARRSLDRQIAGARAQGGYSQDSIQIYDADRGEYRRMEAGVDYDPDQDIREGWATPE